MSEYHRGSSCSPTGAATAAIRTHPPRRLRSLALLAALALTAAALAGSLALPAQAGGPGERPPAWGTVRPWYTRAGLAALGAAPAAIDIRQVGTQVAALITHGEHGPGRTPSGGAPSPRRATAAAATVADAWSDLFTAVSSEPKTGAIMAALLPTGQVMLGARYYHYLLDPHPPGAPVPPEVAIAAQFPPLEFVTGVHAGEVWVQDATFCAGVTSLADGSLIIAGGTRDIIIGSDSYHIGLGQALRYDGAAGWQALPIMQGRGALPEPARWYPTTTRLADGRVLVTGGYEFVEFLTKNLSAEVYDPVAATWSVVTPTNALPPEVFSWQYTHQFQLPFVTPAGEDVLAFGDAGVPGYLKPDGTWRLSSRARPGGRGAAGVIPNLGTSSLLPLRANDGEWGYRNGSVLMAGGQQGSTQTDKIDVYDPVADQWRLQRSMGTMRAHPASVVLPDGRVLILGGEDFATSAGLGRAQYVDPRDNFSVAWGTAEYPEVRGYHNVAVLLPDGRVLFGSGNQNYTRGQLPSYRYYSPSYMFEPRPQLDLAPPVLNYAGYGWLTWSGSEPPAEAVLIGLGAMTHAFDMNQRYVQLPILASGTHEGLHYSIYATPANRRIAPPGYYMLFILDSNRVPSVAKMVQLR